MMLVVFTAPRGYSFALLGPSPATGQTNPAIDWQNSANLDFNIAGIEIGGIVNIGEEYRWVTPEVTYAFDESFLNFFGQEGVKAVNKSFDILNAIPDYDSLSSNLTEYPLGVYRTHSQAESLGVLDMSTITLGLMMEQLGLANPLYYMYSIRQVNNIANSTNQVFTVILRNFDPVTSEPTNRLNGELYNYSIRTNSFRGQRYTNAVEVPRSSPFLRNLPLSALDVTSGGYVSSLSRDDIGGLRYIYRTNNVNIESLPTDAELLLRDTNAIQFIESVELDFFAENTVETTNSAADIAALFGYVDILSVQTNIVIQGVTNYSTFFTNYPGTNFTRQVIPVVVNVPMTNFTYEIGNIFTNKEFVGVDIRNQTVEVTAGPFVPGVGSLQTNVVTNSTMTIARPNGEIILMPPNVVDIDIIETNFTVRVERTNSLISVEGNVFAFTNKTQEVVVSTSNLVDLVENSFGTTNTATDLQTLYPGILITTTNVRFTNIVVTNFVADGFDVTNQLVQVFDYTFGNVITNQSSATTWITNRIVEVAINPFAHIVTEGPFVTNDLFEAALSAGGGVGTEAVVRIAPVAENNDIVFTSKLSSAALNDVGVKFIDDRSFSNGQAEVTYESSSKTIIVNIDGENTTAGTVVNAVNGLSSQGGSAATAASVILMPPGINNDVSFVAATAGAAGNNLLVRLRPDSSLAANVVVPTFDQALGRLTLKFNDNVAVTANDVVAALNASPNPDIVMFRALYSVALDSSVEVGNTGAGQLGFGGGFVTDFDVVASGGADGAASSLLVSVPGLNNDLLITALVGGVAFDGLTVTFVDRGEFDGNEASVSYDALANTAAIRVNSDVTDANVVIAALNGDVGFSANYVAALSSLNDLGNTGTGTFSPVPFVAALDLTNEIGNDGSGLIGGNVNLSILSAEMSGDFFIVPTNAVGYEHRFTLDTNFSFRSELFYTNTTTRFTNYAVTDVVMGVDVKALTEASLTNTPAEIQMMFPDIVITEAVPYVTTDVVPVITATNYFPPYRPVDQGPIIVSTTNFVTNVVQRFAYKFGNVVTNFVTPTSQIAIERVEAETNPYAPALSGIPTLNAVRSLVETNIPSGIAIIIPEITIPRIYGYHIVSTQAVVVTETTNNVFSAAVTNNFIFYSNTVDVISFNTNYFYEVHPIEFRDPLTVGVTGTGVRREVIRPDVTWRFSAREVLLVTNQTLQTDQLVFTEEEVRGFDSSTYRVVPFVLNPATNSVALRRGIGRLQFRRLDYDSLVGANIVPLTNTYDSVMVTNSLNSPQRFRRVATTPDIVFRAYDISDVDDLLLFDRTDTSSWINNDTDNGSTQLAGPGVIQAPVVLDFSSLGVVSSLIYPATDDSTDAFDRIRLGSFDGSGAPIVVFPLGTSIQEIENSVSTNSVSSNP